MTIAVEGRLDLKEGEDNVTFAIKVISNSLDRLQKPEAVLRLINLDKVVERAQLGLHNRK